MLLNDEVIVEEESETTKSRFIVSVASSVGSGVCVGATIASFVENHSSGHVVPILGLYGLFGLVAGPISRTCAVSMAAPTDAPSLRLSSRVCPSSKAPMGGPSPTNGVAGV